MKRSSISVVPMLCSCFLLIGLGFTPSVTAQTYHVLLVGDSWAELMWYDNVLDTVFANNGSSDLHAKGDVTAVSGTKASDWATTPFLDAITDELDANPSIGVVQLVVGGNDFLAGQSGGGWYQGMSTAAEDALFAQIVADIATVVDYILAYDPDIQVLLSSYDYTNFNESLVGVNGASCTNYYNDLGTPTAEQINTAGAKLENLREAMAAARPRVTSVRNYGLMQWTFGYPSLSIPPGTLVPPGDITLPSPPEAMALNCDCTHLNVDGYEALVQNLWDEYYLSYFFPIFEDGFESGNTTAWSRTVQ